MEEWSKEIYSIRTINLIMEKYFRVYKRLLLFNLSMLFAYRANFVNSVLSSLAWGIFSVLSIILLTSKTSIVFGWKREELYILAGCFSIAWGIFITLFSRNFDRFPRIINRGELDLILTKPMDSQFLLSFWIINYTSILRIIIGIIFVFYIAQKTGINIDFQQILGFCLLTIFGLSLLYSIWFLITGITIWFSRLSNITELLYSITSISGRPPEMFKEFSQYVFLFLFPLTLVVATPTRYLLGKGSFENITLLLLISVFFLVASRLFWKFALRFYTSAGG